MDFDKAMGYGGIVAILMFFRSVEYLAGENPLIVGLVVGCIFLFWTMVFYYGSMALGRLQTEMNKKRF